MKTNVRTVGFTSAASVRRNKLFPNPDIYFLRSRLALRQTFSMRIAAKPTNNAGPFQLSVNTLGRTKPVIPTQSRIASAKLPSSTKRRHNSSANRRSHIIARYVFPSASTQSRYLRPTVNDLLAFSEAYGQKRCSQKPEDQADNGPVVSDPGETQTFANPKYAKSGQ